MGISDIIFAVPKPAEGSQHQQLGALLLLLYLLQVLLVLLVLLLTVQLSCIGGGAVHTWCGVL